LSQRVEYIFGALRESTVAELMPLLCADGVRAASTSGVLGDPTTATAVAGAALLGDLGAALIRQVWAWQPVVAA
jgi:creatinine amidohydrolase/Fe(II)-dependent formamide hydrolase-like protein